MAGIREEGQPTKLERIVTSIKFAEKRSKHYTLPNTQ